MKADTSRMDELAERVRRIVGLDPRIAEKNMFGGLTFLLNGHILIGCKKDGQALLSVGKENNAAALARPGATQMIHGERVMQGFVWVDADALEDDDGLEGWVRFALEAVGKMPPAPPKPAKKPKTPAPR
jgi:TfoX/Sxy family transcriptional regulator of competence genes